MHQRETQRPPGKAQRDILTRSLGDLQRLLDVAQRGVVGQQHPARYRETVGECDDQGMRHRVGAAGHGQRPVVVVAPPRTAQRPSGGAARGQRHRQRRPDNEVAFGGVAVGQVDDGLRPAQHLGHLAGLSLRGDRREGQPDRQASDRRSTRPAPWFRRPAATPPAPGRASCAPPPARPCRWPATPCPRRPRTALAAPRRRPPEMSTWTRKALPHSRVRGGDAHRGAARVVGGQRVGDLARPLPTQPTPPRCRGWSPTLRHACASRRRRADHRRPPDVRRSTRHSHQPTAGSRDSIAAAQPPVHLGAIGLEL